MMPIIMQCYVTLAIYTGHSFTYYLLINQNKYRVLVKLLWSINKLSGIAQP